MGWEGKYEVSSWGNIRAPGGPNMSLNGGVRYVGVTLYPGKVSRNVHRLVAEAFLGESPSSKPYVLHRNDNPRDNRVENLRWGTASENSKDITRNGNNPNGNKTHCPAGHEYTPDNTYIQEKINTRSRICRSCMRISDSNRYGTPLVGDDDPRHGTVQGYGRNKCRCPRCRKAYSKHRKELKKSQSRN